MAGIFARIVAGEIPAWKVAEDEHYLAFLDIAPLKKGHTLVIPKKEVDDLFQLDNATYLGLMAFSKKVAEGLKKAVDCKKVSMQVIGLEVPHAHVHLVPINSMNDCNFANQKLQLSDAEMAETAQFLAAHIRL